MTSQFIIRNNHISNFVTNAVEEAEFNKKESSPLS
jgi:hypothetical protein